MSDVRRQVKDVRVAWVDTDVVGRDPLQCCVPLRQCAETSVVRKPGLVATLRPSRRPGRRPGRVQNGYVSPGRGGYARPLNEPRNGLISRKHVPARARERTAVPYLSFPRNEGVPGSSPGVGFGICRGFFCMGNHLYVGYIPATVQVCVK
jgi:hypothetical protein